MLKFFLWLSFLRLKLKFSVQTFYQPLFSHTFLFGNFPLAILSPSVILFPSKSFQHQKAQIKSQRQKAKAKGKKQKPSAFLQWVFYTQW
jgi:hypothetical protein